MTSLIDIEKNCTKLATSRTTLAAKLTTLQSKLDAVRAKHVNGIRTILQRTKEQTEHLRQLVEDNPHLFDKPRTVIFAGIKVGLQAGRMRLEIPDPPATIDLIRKHLEQPESYIAIEESPVRAALAQLPVPTLRRLKVNLIQPPDEAIVKAVDSDLDKLVKQLVGDE